MPPGTPGSPDEGNAPSSGPFRDPTGPTAHALREMATGHVKQNTAPARRGVGAHLGEKRRDVNAAPSGDRGRCARADREEPDHRHIKQAPPLACEVDGALDGPFARMPGMDNRRLSRMRLGTPPDDPTDGQIVGLSAMRFDTRTSTRGRARVSRCYRRGSTRWRSQRRLSGGVIPRSFRCFSGWQTRSNRAVFPTPSGVPGRPPRQAASDRLNGTRRCRVVNRKRHRCNNS